MRRTVWLVVQLLVIAVALTAVYVSIDDCQSAWVRMHQQ